MSKIARAVHKIFGSTAGTNQIAQFGSLSAGTPAFTSNIATIQSLSNWLDGWFSGVLGGNSPAIEDMNAVLFESSYQLGYILQAGVPEWETNAIYFKGSVVNSSDSSGLLYVSLTDSNTGNPVTDQTNWKVLNTGFTTKTANYQATILDDIILADASGGSFTVTLPAIAGSYGKRLTIKRIDSTVANLPTVKGSGSEQIDHANTFTYLEAQDDSVTVVAGATKWYVI